MESVFLYLLNMSITASWLVAIVLLIRLMLCRAPKYIRMLLWLMVGIRLVVPISLESVLSLVPSADTVSPQIVYSYSPSINSGIDYINFSVNPVIQNIGGSNVESGINLLRNISSMMAIVWVIVILLMILYGYVSYFLLNRRVKTAVRLRENIWQSEAAVSPFILGLINPRIYIPFKLGEDDIANVVAHENAHIKRKDHWIKPIGYLLLAIYWYNPLIWLSYILLCRDIELACDERVVNKMSSLEKKEYSKSLMSCSVNRSLVSVCPLAFGEVGVKQRIKNILNYRKPAFWIIVVAVVSCVAVSICFLTNPINKNTPERFEVDDFYIYANEELIATDEDFYSATFDFYTDSVKGYDYSDLSTKRLIKIGNTIKDVATAYNNIPFILFVEKEEYADLNEYLMTNGNNNHIKNYIYTVYEIDGKCYTDDEYIQYHIDMEYDFKNSSERDFREEHSVNKYIIVFKTASPDSDIIIDIIIIAEKI